MAAAMKAMKSGGAMKVAMKATMKAAMKAPSMKAAMKAMKSMKVKKVSKIAKGRGAKVAVLKGSKEKTSGGLTKAKLVKSKTGKVVSKAHSLASKKKFAVSPLKKWADATKQARKELKITGFCAIGGASAEGKKLLAKVRSILGKQ